MGRNRISKKEKKIVKSVSIHESTFKKIIKKYGSLTKALTIMWKKEKV